MIIAIGILIGVMAIVSPIAIYLVIKKRAL